MCALVQKAFSPADHYYKETQQHAVTTAMLSKGWSLNDTDLSLQPNNGKHQWAGHESGFVFSDDVRSYKSNLMALVTAEKSTMNVVTLAKDAV
jgi:hypothetical protein